MAHTQDRSAPDGRARLDEVTWSQGGTYEWNRPHNVRYIMVRACGGGGGGAGGFSIFPRAAPRQDVGTAAGGGGGAGAVVSTILLGPLTAARYTVVIGHGGKGAASTHYTSKVATGTPGGGGTATSFTGPDLSFETPGAEGGRAGVYSSRFNNTQNNYIDIVLPPSNSRGEYPGGGAAQNGARGLLGLGGDGNVPGASGGGGGSLGKGGAGGSIKSAGADGGTCAGGGGAGFIPNEGDSSVGGNGGAGSLTLLALIR
jgi:hypothetical protein